MESIHRLFLLITGIVHLLPFSFMILPGQLQKSYGVDMTDPNLQLLLRHRALFFGMIGGFLLYSVIKKRYYGLASFLGLVSMGSFVLLYYTIGGINTQLRDVMLIDIYLFFPLLVITLLYFFKIRNY